MKSKTIIINSQNEQSKGERGILTLYQEDDLLKCRLRLYNTPKLNKFCKIGIYHNDQVYSANLIEKNGVYESSMVGDFDIDKDFYSAIIDTDNENNVLLSGGTYGGYYFNDYSVFNQENNSSNLQNYEEEHAEIVCEEDCDKCAKCKYKEFFYSEQHPIETLEEHIEEPPQSPAPIEETPEQEEIKKEIPVSIISEILPQFDYIFNNYDADEELNSMLPNSKFVKINENHEQYSIGALYENDEMKYICYAVKCNYNSPAPEELGTHYQWLPLDKDDPLSEGYYIVFQDAKDLKILQL